MQYVICAAFLAFVCLEGTAQGKFTWLSREWVPVAQQGKVSVALHWLYPACYTVFALTVWFLTHEPRYAALAALLRLALFDPVLQWSRGDKLWTLGSSSKWDQLLARAPWLNPVLRAGALVAAVALLVWL